MKVFIALTMNMGLLWKPELRDYWSVDAICHTPFWGSYMARDRYLAILAFFHLVNNEERDPQNPDKLFKVRPLFDKLAELFQEAYYPRRELSIDESMVPWRGRLSFRMFIPSKPTRYGVKIYCCCEADTGYVCKMEIYTGAGANGPERNHGENVVKRLAHDFLNAGHVIYMDSFFSSVALFEYLRFNDTMAVGTVVAGRVGVPRCLHPKEMKLKKGEFQFRRKNNLLCLRINDRKNVLLLSTVHTAELSVEGVRRDAHGDQQQAADQPRQPVTTKPKVILDYNKHMNGVDSFDQNLGYYSFNRKTVKWWKRMAMHLIHLAKVQSYILYQQRVRAPKSQYEFTKELIRQLVADVPQKKQVRVQHPPDVVRLNEHHFIENITPIQNNPHPVRVCAVCSFRDKTKDKRYLRLKRTAYRCESCKKPMCFTPCFKLYHTRTDFKSAVVEVLDLHHLFH